MVNVNKLKGKIVECDMNVEELAQKIGMDKSTLYRKMSSGGESFTIREANLIAKTLDCTYEEVNAIFFNQKFA